GAECDSIVRCSVPVTLFGALAVIVTGPAPTPVTLPCPSTVATLGSLVVQVRGTVIVDPSPLVTVGRSTSTYPAGYGIADLETREIVAGAAGSTTFIPRDPVFPPLAALMSAGPIVTPVTCPAWSTLAFGLSDDQVN